jgi:hypothetical protein
MFSIDGCIYGKLAIPPDKGWLAKPEMRLEICPT